MVEWPSGKPRGRMRSSAHLGSSLEPIEIDLVQIDVGVSMLVHELLTGKCLSGRADQFHQQVIDDGEVPADNAVHFVDLQKLEIEQIASLTHSAVKVKRLVECDAVLQETLKDGFQVKGSKLDRPRESPSASSRRN